ncbi:golgin subfamily A member 6-like protein 22 isoform X2 [Parasteatoda tepidariorum]|uniref:golgin subfamily A member 6-like protein 22 isoform X2 n=1 Tax=Parasteatoda tepidariorum TaxID=114398 RepID=UPI00077FE073|nr:golgin subfamily A member 6-like protein 2 isoform X2 [Parasteatoda tepidariorum]
MNEDEWDEILQRFREEGLDTNLPDDSKLLYVWRWLVDAETNCISLRHQLDKLSRRQSDELEEIRSCMEQMCNAWEVKVSRLEEENKIFHEQLNFTGQNSGRMVSEEIGRMIQEEGLSEILELSVIEKFAYLLDLRTRLQTKLEQEMVLRRKCEQLIRISSNLPDCLKLSSPYIQRILERQKDEYEEEIRNQQEAMKHVKEQLKQVHEDELQRLTAENDRLNTELSKLSQKLQELVTHVAKQQEKDTSSVPWVQHILDGTHDKEMKSFKEEVDRLKSVCQEQQKQVREQCETVRILERTNKQLELDNETLAFKLSESLAQFDELEDQLRREATRARRESLFKQLATKESMSVKNNINKLLDNRPNLQDTASDEQVKKLKEESENLKEQLESIQQQLDVMSLKYQQTKDKYREKMYRMREVQEQEQQEWKERFENCEKELSILREMLSREQKWRVQIEADCRKLKSDNQLLKTEIMEKEKAEREKTAELTTVQREVEKVKASTSRPSTSTASPSRRHSVWPVVSYPKKW